MAIIITKIGTKDPVTYKRGCPECGTEFTYLYSDTQDNGWSGGYRMIPCPQCKYPVSHVGTVEDLNHPYLEDIGTQNLTQKGQEDPLP